MDINILANQLCEAITGFLGHTDFSKEGNQLFKSKQQQLISFSKEVNCLPVCVKILSESQNQQISYFASVLLKDKLKYDYYQLDASSIQSAYNMLVDLIKRLREPSSILLTNVVLCLVYLYIHQIQKIGSVMNFFQGIFGSELNNRVNMQYFLKFLELVPEEVKNNRVVIDEESRIQAEEALRNQQTQILQQFHQLAVNMNTQSGFTHRQVQIMLKAFASWLQLDVTNQAIIGSLHQHNLLNLAFSNLHDELLFQAANKSIEIAIQIMKTVQINPNLFSFISEKIFSVMPKFDEKLRQCSFEVVEEYAKLLSEYGSSSAQMLVMHYNESIHEMIKRMLIYTQTQEIQAFASLVDFWECFIDAMVKYSQNSPLSKEISHQILGELFQILFSKIKLSWTDIENLNQISEKNLCDLHQRFEDITQRRQQAGYLFYSISKRLGQQNFVKEVLSALQKLDKSNEQDFWPKAEAIIYSVRDIAQNYPGPTPQICQFVCLFQELNPSLIMVKRTFCRIFHQLFTMKVKNEEFILKVLGYVVSMLDTPLLGDRAQKAFNKCCRENGAIVSKHLQQIYQLLNKYPNRVGILSGMAQVMKNSPETIVKVMPILLRIQIQKLANSLKIQSKSSRKKNLLTTFESIFSLIQSVPKKEVFQEYENLIENFLKEIWPQLKIIVATPYKRENDEDRVIQQAIKLLKIIMRVIPNQFLSYLTEISTHIAQNYRKFPISSFVYFYELIFIQYRHTQNTELASFLLKFFINICNITFDHIRDYGGMESLCILADDFLGLTKRIVTYNKIPMLLQSNQIQNIFKFAIQGLQSSQPRLASSSSQFFQIIFMIFWTPYSRKKYENEDIGEVVEYDPNNIQLYEQLKSYILPSVPLLITDLFKCLEKVPAESTRDNILDCLNAIALAFPAECEPLWSGSLDYLQVDIMTGAQKTKFMNHLKQLNTNNVQEFTKAQQGTSRLLFLISKRYMHRIKRQRFDR